MYRQDVRGKEAETTERVEKFMIYLNQLLRIGALT